MRWAWMLVAIAGVLVLAFALIRFTAGSSGLVVLAPAVSYTVPAGPAPATLAAAVRRVRPGTVQSLAAAALFQERRGVLSASIMSLEWHHLQVAVRIDAGQARYVLLNDSSTLLDGGQRTPLPVLRRRPVWLVPVINLDDTGAAGERDYLVFDAHGGQLLEHLAIQTTGQAARCAAAKPALLRIGQLLCTLRQGGEPPVQARRSAP